MSTRARRLSGDDGLTAIELVIAMLVLAIIMVPLVGSFVIGLATTSQSAQETTNSSDAQILAAFFDGDVASSQVVNPAGASCGTAGTAVLSLRWNDSGAATVVSYRSVQDNTDQVDLQVTTNVFRLERVACTNGSVTDTSIVARQLAAQPTVTCDGPACGPDAKPSTVSLSMSSYARLLASSTERYTFGVTATRKVTS